MGKILNWLDEKMRSVAGKLKESTPAQSETAKEKVEKEHTPVAAKTPVVDNSKKNEGRTKEASKTPIESQDGLLRSVRKTLGKFIENKDSTRGMRLILWLDTDALQFKKYSNDDYRHRITAALVNEDGYFFEDVMFLLGKPAKKLRATSVGECDSEHLQIVDVENPKRAVSCCATISIHGDAGSLLQEQYTLSSTEMTEKGISVYNIGVGKFPKIPTGYRENHIAIDDNPQSPYNDKNMHVSRTHAHIGFSNTFGFYLQVERNGTRLMGKRTRIFRNGEDKPIECDNPQAKIPLKSGDLIELGKAVVLKYTQLNN